MTVCSLLALSVGGCHLFGDYEVPTDPADAPVDASGDTGADTAQDTATDSATDTVTDTTVDTGRDTANDTGTDTKEDAVTDTAGDTVGDTAADTDTGVDTGLPPNQCPDTRPSYRVRRADGQVDYTVDGVCESSEYGHAISVPFPPPGTDETNAFNNTDNTADCRIVWFPGATPTVQACCDVEDSDLVADAEPGDPEDNMFGGGQYTADDRIEMWLKCDLGTASQDCGYKLTVNNREGSSQSGMAGGRPTHLDSKEKVDESFEWLTDAWVVRDPGQGYVLEWRAEVPFGARAGGTHACELSLFDVDRTGMNGEPEEGGKMRPFAGDGSVNDPASWGCCFFE